ncbi:MAG: restriction endonuclease subunit S [Ignavibacteria bacterium]
MKWDNKYLCELAEINSGYAFKSNEMRSNKELSSIPVIKIKNVNNRNVYKKCDSYLPINAYKSNYSKYILNNGDILVAMTGQGSVGRIGKMREVDQLYLVNQRVGIVRVKENIANPEFIYQQISNTKTEKYYYDLAFGAGQPNLSPTDIGSLKIIYPPLLIQRKIASILSAYDDLIENNLRRIKLLEEKAQLHYKELITEMSNSKTKREEYVKDCLEFYIGGGWGEENYEEKFTEPAYVIRGTDIPNVRRGDISDVPFRYHKSSNLVSRKIQEGDIVFEISNGQINNIGRTVFISQKLIDQFDLPVMCASFAKLIRVNEIVSPEYFYLYLNEGQKNGLLYEYKSNSANGINNFAFETFIKEVKITLPNETELKNFTQIIKPIFSLINTIGEQNTKLREARDILLPRLMSGEIEV